MSAVGVLGAGTMGVGIAVTVSRAGHETIVRDVAPELVESGLERVEAFLDQSVARGKLTAVQRDEQRARVHGTTALGDLASCDVVIEAIVEDVSAKAAAFAALDDVCKPDTLFHTNTSTLAVTGIAAGSRHPERVVGTHYCNPAPLMRLVEVARGLRTADWAYERTVGFLGSLGKTVVTTGDTPGFIVNRFLVPFENDCVRALAAGMGTVESIDRAVTCALGFPMGPFALLDVVGLDVHRLVSLSLYDQLRDTRFLTPPLVDRMIDAGHLGRKSGKGFYEYGDVGLFGTGRG